MQKKAKSFTDKLYWYFISCLTWRAGHYISRRANEWTSWKARKITRGPTITLLVPEMLLLLLLHQMQHYHHHHHLRQWLEEQQSPVLAIYGRQTGGNWYFLAISEINYKLTGVIEFGPGKQIKPIKRIKLRMEINNFDIFWTAA